MKTNHLTSTPLPGGEGRSGEMGAALWSVLEFSLTAPNIDRGRRTRSCCGARPAVRYRTASSRRKDSVMKKESARTHSVPNHMHKLLRTDQAISVLLPLALCALLAGAASTSMGAVI